MNKEKINKQMLDCIGILKQTRVQANKQVNPLTQYKNPNQKWYTKTSPNIITKQLNLKKIIFLLPY